jgi:hypothetical protein
MLDLPGLSAHLKLPPPPIWFLAPAGIGLRQSCECKRRTGFI